MTADEMIKAMKASAAESNARARKEGWLSNSGHRNAGVFVLTSLSRVIAAVIRRDGETNSTIIAKEAGTDTKTAYQRLNIMARHEYLIEGEKTGHYGQRVYTPGPRFGELKK